LIVAWKESKHSQRIANILSLWKYLSEKTHAEEMFYFDEIDRKESKI
jgi:hypothetical protein